MGVASTDIHGIVDKSHRAAQSSQGTDCELMEEDRLTSKDQDESKDENELEENEHQNESEDENEEEEKKRCGKKPKRKVAEEIRRGRRRKRRRKGGMRKGQSVQWPTRAQMSAFVYSSISASCAHACIPLSAIVADVQV